MVTLVCKLQNDFSAMAADYRQILKLGLLYSLFYLKGGKMVWGGATARLVVLTYSEAPGPASNLSCAPPPCHYRNT